MRKAAGKCRFLIVSLLFVMLFTSQAFAIYTNVGVPASTSYVSAKNKNKNKKVYIFVGDSRTMHMTESTVKAKDDCAFVWKNGGSVSCIGKGGDLTGKLDTMIRKYRKNCVVILNFGVNGNGNPKSNAKNIKKIYNSWIKKYPKVKFYVESVNPTSRTTSPYKNSNVNKVNAELKKAFKDRYIDMNAWLIRKKYVNTKNGRGTTDGLHYTYVVYQKILDHTKTLAK